MSKHRITARQRPGFPPGRFTGLTGQQFRCLRPRSRWGGLFTGIVFSGAAIQAQEALNSALSLDQVLKQNESSTVLPPESPHMGPVQYTVGAYAGAQWDDNIYLSQNHPQADTIISAGLNLGFIWPATEQSEVNLNSQIGYASYLRFRGNDYLEIAPGSALTWTFSLASVSVTFYDQVSAAEETLPVASVSNAGRIPRIDNTAGTRLTWQPGSWQVEAGYSHDTFFSGSGAYAYLDRSAEYFYARGAWRFSVGSALGLEASASTTAYDLASQSDNTSYSLGPYLQWAVTPYIAASVRGGPTIYSFASTATGTAASNLSSYYVELDLSDQITDFFSQQLSVQRSVSLGYNIGINYTEQYTVNYSLHWAAAQWLDLRLNLTYENGRQPLGGYLTMVNENYSRYGINPSVYYQLTKSSSLTLNYTHWDRLSNIPGAGYTDDSVSLQFQYAF